MKNEISEEKLKKYFKLTETALKEVRRNIISGREIDAREIVNMVSNYISDAHHFKDRGDWINAFAALNYAHGWLDSGVRLKVFDVNNRDLFTVC